MKSLVTVLTPTYNRADTLPRLYDSLKRQSNKDFKWFIIDDGSTDNTKHLVDSWNIEGNFEIIYRYKNNGGKMSAVNEAVKLIDTELICFCDSDDYMSDNAIDLIYSYWNKYCNGNISGMIGYRLLENSQNNNSFPDGIVTTRLWELFKNGVYDTTQIYRTSILKKNLFPDFEGERFVPEAAIWIQIDLEYEVIVLPEVLEKGKYLEDGYTISRTQGVRNNPMGFAFLFFNKYRYEKKFGKYINCILELGKCVALSAIAKNQSLVKGIAFGERLLSMPIAVGAYIKYKFGK